MLAGAVAADAVAVAAAPVLAAAGAVRAPVAAAAAPARDAAVPSGVLTTERDSGLFLEVDDGMMRSARLVIVVGTSMLFALAEGARAGIVYTNETDFLNALGGAGPLWSEDFEGFALGPAIDPLPIGGGAAEVVDGNNSIIWDITPLGDKAWLQIGALPANAAIRGLGATSVNVGGIAFELANENPGTWNFDTSLGLDISGPYPVGGNQDRIFIGWVGFAGETLDLVQFSAQGGIVLDNIAGYEGVIVPEPSGLALLGMGVTGLCGCGWRRKRLHAA